MTVDRLTVTAKAMHRSAGISLPAKRSLSTLTTWILALERPKIAGSGKITKPGSVSTVQQIATPTAMSVTAASVRETRSSGAPNRPSGFPLDRIDRTEAWPLSASQGRALAAAMVSGSGLVADVGQFKTPGPALPAGSWAWKHWSCAFPKPDRKLLLQNMSGIFKHLNSA